VNYASSKGDADRVVGEIIKAGGKAGAIQADVAKRADVKRLFEETMEKLGRPNILVNNAGVYAMGPLEAVTEEEFPSPVQHQRARRDPRCAGGHQGIQRLGR
jgi:3-oxoacyl-[acyl-carrier protein] reductase